MTHTTETIPCKCCGGQGFQYITAMEQRKLVGEDLHTTRYEGVCVPCPGCGGKGILRVVVHVDASEQARCN